MNQSERNAQAKRLAEDILTLSRNTLLVDFRYLNRGLSRLEFVSDEMVSLAADGVCLYYNPWYVLSLYRSEPSAVVHDLLHSLLHCVFRHNFVGRDVHRSRWDTACDVAVEAVIGELAAARLHVRHQRAQQGTLALLGGSVSFMTAEHIYRWLEEKGLEGEELDAIRRPFQADNHGLWYGKFDKDAQEDEKIALKKIWEEVSKRMQTELETMTRDASGSLIQSLRQLNRTKRDYTEFLRRFGIQGEWMHLSEEEFDHNYYSYGLSLYGDVLLVEPLEYAEQRKIREFVIAIDTSGSVRGDVVQSFIQHTHDILSRQDSFFQKVELHIIQCDDRIREDALIQDREEFQNYLQNMEIKGLGQTDFRPVFSYVEDLRQQGELRNLQGLLYFTDGDGTFPGQKPGYDVAFIIHNDGFQEPKVPSWAMKLTLREEDILNAQFVGY